MKETAETNNETIGVTEGNSSNETSGLSREERFKALRRRAHESMQANRTEVYNEHKKSKIDDKQQSRAQRQTEKAEFELAKLDANEKGEDFERQRAWDWTVEESEKWNEKLEQKKQAIDNSIFSDYVSAAERAYKKDMLNIKPDLVQYQKDKLKELKKNAVLLEEDGKVIAYDQDGSGLDNSSSLGFVNEKPSKASVDRLVDHLRKGDERRMKRRKGNDDDHVTYINEKNKQFNQKLSRYYDKYTKETRDSFDRGTAL
jgi:pre-mRNA-splicing factor SYF2